MNQETLKTHLQPLVNTFKDCDWSNQNFYEQYLAQTYYYTFHSTRMLAYAAAMTTSGQESYYKRSLKHITEEEGHEKMALNDLKRLGKTIETFEELPTTKAFWQSQYYYINKNCSSLLGYILALEWLAVEAFPSVLSKVKPLYGANSTNFIRVHAEEDPGHVDECLSQINAMPKEDQKLIIENFIQSCRMFTLFMYDVEFSTTKSDEYYDSLGKKNQVVGL